MPSKRSVPAFKGVWRTKTVRNEMTCNSISEAISYIFFAVETAERGPLIEKLKEIDAKLTARESEVA